MEVEIKLAIKDPEGAREALRKKGKFLKKVVEEDTYFNFDCEGGCCRNFAETDEAVRLRRRDGECFLTYKGPRVSVGEVKAREEIEFSVDSCEAAASFLEKLCLKPAARVRKEREYWSVENAVVTLDYVEGLGWFAEVEGEGVKELAEELFPGAEPVEETYLEMVLKRAGAPRGK
ncbi:MAG: class IV adenylate cyclase [Crenarchaeota archaeon]|nr:class IV adenylate cyclase [Thermoproteota archaeon]